jgi:asparagine synthase (glutamine-hydrolysing)
VRKLPPAHVLILEGGAVSLRRYWRLDYSSKLQISDPRELCDPILDALRLATRRRLVADVPLGAFLSGGIDSSAVVAAMAHESTTSIKTFSIGFGDASFDELRHARRVAEQFSTDHHELVVRPDAVAMVPRMARHYGEPFADPSAIPSFHLAALARTEVTVALNGDGGDESFGGYNRYVANQLAMRLERLPAALRRMLAAPAGRMGGGEVTSLANKVRRLAQSLPLDPPARYRRYVAWFDDVQRSQLYSDDFAALLSRSPPPDVIGQPWREASGSELLDVMLEVDASTYLPGDLLTKIDIATMAYALEARSPFLDHELMQFAAAIPADLKLRGREKKWILREALRRWLPDDLIDRPKQGFSVPLASWLRNDLSGYVRDVLLDPGSLGRGYFRPEMVKTAIERQADGAEDEAKRVWALLMLELWHREFVTLPQPTSALTAVA